MAYQSEIEKLKRRYDEKPEQWFAALADAHRKAGDLDRAIRIVEEGIKQRPNYVSGHIVLGRCLVDQGADDRAEKVFEEVLELDAENIIALKVLGDVSERRGNREAARRWLGRLLEVDPMNDEARAMLEIVSQPEPEPAITPINPDVPIITQSAARAAGVASTPGRLEDEAGTPTGDSTHEDPEKSPSGNKIAADSTTSVRELLDAAAASPPSNDKVADGGLVIERAKEALPSGEHGAMDIPPFEAFSESETKMVSFDPPDKNSEPESDLAAGTLDFVAREPDKPADDTADTVLASDNEPNEPAELDPLDMMLDEAPLELELAPEPEVVAPLPHGDQVSTNDLPEDVASIFASAPPIGQLGNSDEKGQREVEDPPAEETLEPSAEIEADFLEVDVEPVFEESEVIRSTASELAEKDQAEEVSNAGLTIDAELVEEKKVEEKEEEAVVEEKPVATEPPFDQSVADILVDASIVGSIVAPEPEVDPPSPLVTETMAEVYAAQGHFDQARDVYRQLLADSPGDEGLQTRLAALEERANHSKSSTSKSENDVPTNRYAAAQTGGESVLSMLTGLLAGSPPQTEVATEEEVVFVAPSEPSPLEQAFGESPMVAGKPAHPATDGPSLAAVFGDEPEAGIESEVSELTQEEDKPGLTYDGFYGSQDRASSPQDNGDEADDDDGFKAWLQSLKS